MRRDVFVFDIETVTDADAARRLLNKTELTDNAARDALGNYFLEKTAGRNDFPRQPFHQVVAISYVQMMNEPGEEGAELLIRRVASGGDLKSSERDLLEGFFGLIEKRAPRLISYNGRGFDIPVLKSRAMVHAISCPRWFSEGDKWNNYDSRYASKYHVDLIEALSDYGASARCSMDEIATVLGLPGKLDTSGSDVRSLFEAGDIGAIRNYCETDVLTTTLIYLRWLHLRGDLGRGAYARALLGVRNYLEGETESRPHLGEFLEAWPKTES
ncbi:MAG: 3'-5' exonuclease [Mariprofundaceae bacterium]